MLRSNGAAVFGAVRVAGGVLYVLKPRLPELRPPPTRASASEATSNIVARMASNMTNGRKRWSLMGSLSGLLCEAERRPSPPAAPILVRQRRFLRAGP